MKTTVLLGTALLGLLLAPTIPAQQSTPPVPNSAQTAPTPAEFEKFRAQMLEQMKTMQAQMDKIQKTDDPQARQKLLQEHWTSMRNAMGMMNGMWGPGMMGCCVGTAAGSTPTAGGPMMRGPMMGGFMMGGPMMWSDYRNLTPEQLKQRQYMMGQYMGMQQMMMDHMMWQQYWMTPQAMPAPAPK